MSYMAESEMAHEEAEQRALWRRQVDTLPSLRGGKRVWVPLVVELVKQIASGAAVSAELRPDIPAELFEQAARKTGGTAPSIEPATWREYGRFLKSVGLAETLHGGLGLTLAGQAFQLDPTHERLGNALTGRFRLLGESLAFISAEPRTVEGLDAYLREQYKTAWKSLSGTRDRMDWLDALGLIESSGSRRWKINAAGEKLLTSCTIVNPATIATSTATVRQIAEAPEEIKSLLNELVTGERPQDSRSSYNIWVPSPAFSPNKVENLRTIVNAALEPIEREELLQFIAETFRLRRTSVDSMMPFLRASGLLHEIGLNIYEATTPAKAWVASEEDINFIRILHANMRFVGEMLQIIGAGTTRNEIYRESEKYGLNVDKSRWIASFLEDAELVEKPRYGSLRNTPLGLAFLEELPLASVPSSDGELIAVQVEPGGRIWTSAERDASCTENLVTLSQTPNAQNLGSGKAFEYAIRNAFLTMGFNAQTISGSGDTDVLVSWRDDEGSEFVAVVEAKSRSNGHVTHSDISDVALETHKNHHKAEFVAVVGPTFAGETIKNMATKRKWALINAQQLGDILDAAAEIGLSPTTTGLLFKVPNGLDELAQIIKQRRRELSVISFVMSQLAHEAADTSEAITARDISRDARKSELRPTVEEVLAALAQITRTATGAIRESQIHNDPKFTTYAFGNAKSAAWKLRALADAIDTSLSENLRD